MLAPDPRFARIDGLNGFEFEAAVADLLERLGFEDVTRMNRYDLGADIVAVWEGVRTAVQVKRWNQPVDLASVRQLIDGQKRYGCDAGLLVTNSYLTEPAVECAEHWEIEVWDRSVLADFLEGDTPDVDVSVCAHCGKTVSQGTTKWCLDHPGRYGGSVYCRFHQPRSRRRAE
jgi:predicted RecB family endonuclease